MGLQGIGDFVSCEEDVDTDLIGDYYCHPYLDGREPS